MIELNKIYNEDCLEGMKRIPDGSVDCIVCDLPYGTTACKGDSIIPFEPMWEEYKRIRKPNAPIVLFGSQPFTSLLIASNIEEFREELIWVKNNSPSGFRKETKHLKRHENIVVFGKDAKITFNPQKTEAPENMICNRKTFIHKERNNIIGASGFTRVKNVDDGTRFPTSVMHYKRPYHPKHCSSTKNGDWAFHPTQKPVALIQYLIRTYSNDGDTILDNCMGSGTTAIAAIREKRNFIGFELNKEYYDKACNRIKMEMAQPTLF